MRRWGVVLCLALGLGGCGDDGPWDGPFGTRMGLNVASLGNAVQLVQDPRYQQIYLSDDAPENTQWSDAYEYRIAPKAGLCSVSGTSNVIQNASQAEQDKLTAPLLRILTAQYGTPEMRSNEVVQGGWRLTQRVYIWSADSNTLPRDVRFVGLSADSGTLRLSYEFSNINDCLAEERARGATEPSSAPAGKGRS